MTRCGGAPRVVAKGADHVAARIRELADKSRVPMVQDIALASTLYQVCDIGQEIPADMYQGVATVLAFVLRLKRRGSAAGTHRLLAARSEPGRVGHRLISPAVRPGAGQGPFRAAGRGRPAGPVVLRRATFRR